VSKKDPVQRRAYQNRYYKSPEQKLKRRALQLRYAKRVALRIFVRDGYRCRYCGRVFGIDDLHVDHFIPRSRGGRNVDANRVTSCARCNHRNIPEV
jgi:5-methylcytosine-specific restriction endonuclease McrA